MLSQAAMSEPPSVAEPPIAGELIGSASALEANAADAALLAEMENLGALLAQLQFERQNLSAALSEKLQAECNRVGKMTRVLQQGKRRSDDDDDDPNAHRARRRAEDEDCLNKAGAVDCKVTYRSAATEGFPTSQTGVVADDELDAIVDSQCMAPGDELQQEMPTYRSCSGSMEEELLDELYDEVEGTPALAAVREAVKSLGALVEKQASLQGEAALEEALESLSRLAVRA